MTEPGTHRTTVLLRDEDQDNLKHVSKIQGVTDTETIRRALRHYREDMDFVAPVDKGGEGGEIIYQKGRKRERIRFF